MKVHYFNILLFYLSLNILLLSSKVYNQRNHYITRTSKTNTRALCECELYAPSNYDNDPEMKEVMQYFDRQTSQHFEEYNERIIKNRQKCKEKCEKDIQKIILKDKIEKELAEKFVTLETNIDTNDIPTCVCEKSIEDKMEKTCLKCGGVLGGGVAPAWGLLSGLGYSAWTNYAGTTLVKIATDKSIAEGLKVGLTKATEIATQILKDSTKVPSIDILKNVTADVFTENITLLDILKHVGSNMYDTLGAKGYSEYCFTLESIANPTKIRIFYPQQAAAVTNAVSDAKKLVLADAAHVTSSLYTVIIASVVAIVIIVFVMVIIYLILRYRRKKKMKKKSQYIKLLKE
ncbi:surface antigen [Plasmodium falciparum UGT5.1]|uniref:Surface antigen n=1 Tax=Plasmodium falciparum UGT5.1 TaxID=1237627 RepID=W7K4G7_PLAFA|nr:surface antigen [Plasmodium falciparum UGT5.1]